MGFSAMLDILGSTIIGSVIFLILLRMNDAATQSTYTYMGDVIVQGNLVATIQIIEHDFRKIGYCLNYSKNPRSIKSDSFCRFHQNQIYNRHLSPQRSCGHS